jgi:protocatechuate 3,4-dioxygenase beta subunit
MMSRIRLSACVAACAVLTMHLALAAGQTTAPSRVEGSVQTSGAKPVAGAKVRLFDSSKSVEGYPLIQSGATDSQGHFSIPAGDVKRVIVAIQAPGLGLCLFNSPTAGEPLSVILQPAGVLKVRLVRADGLPALGSKAGISSFYDATNIGTTLPEQLKQELSRLSDAAGICTYTELPQDARVSVEVSDDQSVRATASTQVDDDAPVTLKLEPAGVVEGKVTLAENGQPASGVRVYGRVMYDAPGGRGRAIASSSAVTDPQGKYRIGQMRGGSGTISVSLASPLNSQYVSPPGVAVTITPGQQTQAPDITLSGGLTVRGKVTMEDGSPAARAQVMLIQRTPGQVATSAVAVTGEDGTYALRVLPGVYEIRATLRDPQLLTAMSSVAAGTPPQTTTISQDATQDLQVHPQPASPPPPTASVLRSGRGPTSVPAPSPLQGTVVDEQGQPVAGVSITLTDNGMVGGGGSGLLILDDGVVISGAPGSSQATTDAAGHFEVKAVRNGALLYARKDKMGLLNRVTIGDDRDLKLVLYRDPTGGVKFKVVDNDGKPLAGAVVGIQSYDPGVQPAPRWLLTAADGSFSLSGLYPNGNYTVTVHVHGYSIGNSGPQIQGGKQIEAPPIRLYRLDSSISGMAVTEAGEPAANVELRVMGGRGGSKTFSTDAEGRFTVKNLPTGETVNIYAYNEGRTYRLTQLPAGTQDALIVYTQPPQPAVITGRGAR